MALKLTIPFPIFAPPQNPNPNQNPNPSSHRPPTEIRFSQWNNAHAEKFNQRQRAQQEIEDDIRRHRRFDSATKIAQIYESATSNEILVKSTGTPSSASKPSIPGKKSKYSKPANPNDHPAFRRISKPTKTVNLPSEKPLNAKADVKVSKDGVSYLIDGAPFEFQYSYTETPKVKPLKLREAPFTPFGPTTMSRPWTGRAPLPPSKKKLKEFDSFELPPPNKKGVKPVQKPGPFLTGSGPKYVSSREEILGEPLTKEEVTELVNGCMKSNRQLNMGRDGLTHNMLDNIHAHWKRRRVCKIKCKGVCTVDMENVCQQLEERTGGKIIYRRGGVLYLFRGRNYNYKTRPRFPLMLWKPVTPVYPRLIQQAPEGLTLGEATEMRKKGRKLIPICKLGKNGVYCDLVKNVREAFEECELVRINCQGMNGSDHRKIGAKLKDLVPCVLISFEHEHILMWRGQEWKCSLPKPESDSEGNKESEVGDAIFAASPLEGSKDVHAERRENLSSIDDNKPSSTFVAISTVMTIDETIDETTSYNSSCSSNEINAMGNIQVDVTKLDISGFADDESETVSGTYGLETKLDNKGFVDEEPATTSIRSETMLGGIGSSENNSESSIVDSLNHDKVQNLSEFSQYQNGPARLDGPNMERVSLLMKQAVESGIAMVLDDSTLDADSIYKKSVAFAESAPPGPVFRRQFRKIAAQKNYKKDGDLEVRREVSAFSERDGDLEVKREVSAVSERGNVRQTSRGMEDINAHCLNVANVAPQGSLGLDELAKLLA